MFAKKDHFVSSFLLCILKGFLTSYDSYMIKFSLLCLMNILLFIQNSIEVYILVEFIRDFCLLRCAS